MNKLVILSVAFLLLAALSAAAAPGDVLLGIPTGLKLGASLSFAPQVVQSIIVGDGFWLAGLPVVAALGVPSGFLLWNEITSNAQGVRFWHSPPSGQGSGL